MATSTLGHPDVHNEFHAGIDWRAGLWAGLIAGLVFMLAEMAMVALIQGESPWAPPRMIAAMVLGQDVLPPPATFDLGIVSVAMLVHFGLSLVYGALFALLARHLDRTKALIVGAVLGLVLYVVNFYPIAAAMFPWFAMARNGISIAAHLIFGVALAAAYTALRRTA